MPRAGLAALLDAMRTVDPATPVWTFSRSDPTATFWHRRMAHETVVHRVDAEQATGAVGPLDPALVVDGIAESLEVFAPLVAAARRTRPRRRCTFMPLMSRASGW